MRIDIEILKSLQNICFMERFLASLMEKKQKQKIILKMGKYKKKRYLLSLRIELNTFRNGRGEMKVILKMGKPKKRRYWLSLRIELNTFHNGRGG